MSHPRTKRGRHGLRSAFLRFLVVTLLGAASPGAAAQVIETYSVQHRRAAELMAVAEGALGEQGHVTLDERTATLILDGTPAAVRRTLALLEEIDRPLHHLVITCEVRRLSELREAGIDVQWKLSKGSLRIGTAPLSMNSLHVALGAQRENTRRAFRSTLRLLEGGTGLIVTGKALPFVYLDYWGERGVDFIPAETGFEVQAFVRGDGKVQLDLRPFSGRLEEDGVLRYTQAGSSLTLSPGETAMVGEVSSETGETDIGLQGGRTTSAREREVLLVSVEIDEP